MLIQLIVRILMLVIISGQTSKKANLTGLSRTLKTKVKVLKLLGVNV